MNPSSTIGRIAGIRIGVNWSWLVVFALIAWTLEASVFPSQDKGLSKETYIGMALIAALLFFVSLLLHEFGHALQARREGMEIDGITLWLFGGVARFKGMFPSAGSEFRIALAGPLVSLAIGGACVAVAASTRLAKPVDGVVAWLGYINLVLLAFNLLPALPLDGGRLLRAALWRAKDDFGWATRIASDLGRGFGFVLIGGGLAMLIFQGAGSGAWLAFVGWFLLQAAAAEGRYAIVREALSGLRVSDLIVRDPATADAGQTLGEFIDEVAHAHRFTTYPVLDGGRTVGLLPFGSVARVPRAQWETRYVRDCMLPRDEVPVLSEDDELADALPELAARGINRALVMDGERLVGLLSITDVARLLAAARPRAK